GGAHGRPTPLRDVLAGTSHELASVRFTEFEDRSDLFERVSERLAEHVRRAFGRAERFEQPKHRELERLTPFRAEARVGACIDGLRKPWPDVRLAPSARGLRDVDGEARRDGRKECGYVPHAAPVRILPAEPRVLHDVLGF